MREYHRKTLIKRESWALIDDWYYCPLSVVEDRIDNEKLYLAQFSSLVWANRQKRLEARLAHACDDGKIRAPSHVEYYKTKAGTVSIYGKCRTCNKPLSNGLKAILIMEREL